MKDQVSDLLRNLPGDLPVGRDLTEAQKDKLIDTLGYKTVQNILSLKSKQSKGRILFVFNSLDPQLVADALDNDLALALERKKKPPKRPGPNRV